MLLAYGVTMCESADIFGFEVEFDGAAAPVRAANATAERWLGSMAKLLAFQAAKPATLARPIALGSEIGNLYPINYLLWQP